MDNMPAANIRFVVVLSGPPATGKNTIAQLFCHYFPKAIAEIDLDKVKGFVASDPRSDYYLDLAAEICHAMVRIYLSSDLSVFVHNAFCSYDYVRPFIAIADELKVPVWYFKLTATLEATIERNRVRTIPTAETEVRRVFAIDQACKHPEGITIDTMKYDADEAARLIMQTITAYNDTTRMGR